jgi:uncharacterized protein Yka (UPF0111/DUF47 family)
VGLLEDMLAADPALWDKAEEIKEVELYKCDTLTHQIIQRLNSTFVTPIDRGISTRWRRRWTTSWMRSTRQPR